MFKDFATALFDGGRAIVFMRPRAGAFNLSGRASVLLALIAILVSALCSYVLAQEHAWFSPWGVTSEFACQSVLLGLLVLLPFRRSGAEPLHLFNGVNALGICAVLIMILAVMGWRFFAASFGEGTAAIIAFGAWVIFFMLFVAALVRLGHGLARHACWRTGLGVAAVAIAHVFLLPHVDMFPSPDAEGTDFSVVQKVAEALRPAPVPRKREIRASLDVEDTLRAQPEIVSRQLAAIQPPRDDRAELYFVGIAPDGSQSVFRREVEAVKALFDTRFGTAGRSLLLINNRDTVGAVPLASRYNIEDTLVHVGRVMRREKDVLVLFITTHGSEGSLSVYMPGGFPFSSITPQRLVAALDKAGIDNRVLVISACHSGSFLPTLRNDQTLVMTASSAERTSFGCSNENEWTWFGDAYFNQALRANHSFVEAFARAERLVASWEKRDGVTPSEPQIFIGDAIRRKLDAMERERLGREMVRAEGEGPRFEDVPTR